MQVGQEHLHDDFELEAQHPEFALVREVEHLLELVFHKKRDHEPKRVLFVLLQMNEGGSSYKIHALSISQHFLVCLRCFLLEDC